MIGTHAGDYLGDYVHRLVLLGVGLEYAYLLTGLPHRIALLRYAPLVVRYQRVRGVHYRGCGPVVPLQTEHMAVGIVFLEVQYVLYLGAAERVDGLAVVAHDADVAVRLREFLEYQVLGVVGVLVLVHHDIQKALGNGLQGVLVVAQQDVHVQQDVVEVHDPRFLELLLIELVEVAQTRLAGVRIGDQQFAVGAVAGHRHEVVLGHRDAGQHLAGLVHLVVELKLLDAGLHRALGIGRVIDHETLGIAEKRGILPQEADEHRMEGAHHEPAGAPAADHRLYSLLHLAGRLLGEGQREYPGRIRSFGEQEGYPARQHPGLSGTGSGDYEHGASGAADGISLLLVQPLENCFHFLLHSPRNYEKIGYLRSAFCIS